MMTALLALGGRSQSVRAVRQSQRCWLSSAARESVKPASSYPGWRVLEERRVTEFDIEATLLEHSKTKARYLHMACQDENNAFSVNFRTTPMDSTGVAHILEHTALCGSTKFPVRDPFMKMLNRSLSTFMNAMTGPDYTLYPFSTCNRQDYYNLMSVYLDSVFHPLLREQDFLQEGWRLEHEELDDPSTPLVIKGVVYNEMKGAYANAQSLFGQQLLSNLYPSHTYSNSSGGYPLSIPGLSWEGLKQFHAAHYHPSNCRILSYGSLPLEEHLHKIDSEYLSKFEYLAQDTSVPDETRWTEPRRVNLTCAPDPMQPDPTKPCTVAVSYLLADIRDLNTSFALQVLSELLLGGPASPCYKALIETELGSNFSPVSGFEDHVKETNLTIGLQNVAEADTERVIEAIQDTLETVVREGFDDERIEAVLHSYELGLKHKSANFGMNLIMSLTPFWNHADSPLDFLEVNRTVAWFRGRMEAEPGFLQELVRTCLLENSHRLVQSMGPVAEYAEREQEQFDRLEAELREGLGEEERRECREKCVQLQSMQNDKEDVSCLPSLRVCDIPTSVPSTELQQVTISGNPVQISQQPTNEVSYFRALLDTSDVPADLLPLLPIFTSVLTKMGAAHLDFKALDTAVELRTGGLASSMHVQEHQADLSQVTQAVLLSSNCLDRNTEHMFSLWSHVFSSVHWQDTNRLAALLRMSATAATNGLPQSGHRYAMTAAASSLSPAAFLSEQFSGMTHLNLLNRLSQEDVTKLVKKLQIIAGLVLNKKKMKVALNTSQPELFAKATEVFLNETEGQFDLDLGGQTSESLDFKAETQSQHFVTPFPINFTSLSVPTVPYSHPDHAPLKVLASLLSSKYLHSEIREKGGAYGGGATQGSGAFTYYSYRDPNNLETFSVYRKSTDWALEENYSQAEVEEAVLRVFQTLDAPVAPGYRGLRYFLSGISDEDFARHRVGVMEAKVTDLKAVAERYLLEPPMYGKALIGGANKNLNEMGWKVHEQR